MKTLISKNSAYSVLAEIIQPIAPTDVVQLKFYTQWEDAKNPNELHEKFSMMLAEEDRLRLKAIL